MRFKSHTEIISVINIKETALYDFWNNIVDDEFS